MHAVSDRRRQSRQQTGVGHEQHLGPHGGGRGLAEVPIVDATAHRFEEFVERLGTVERMVDRHIRRERLGKNCIERRTDASEVVALQESAECAREHERDLIRAERVGRHGR